MEANDYLTLANWVDIAHWITLSSMFFLSFGFYHKKTIWLGITAIVMWITMPFTWLLFGGCPFEILADHLRFLGGANPEEITDPFIVSAIKNLFGITIQDNVIITLGVLISLFVTIYTIPLLLARSRVIRENFL